MLALAGTDAAAAVVFGLVYAAAAARRLTQPAFVAALVIAFAGATALWVHVERSGGRGRDGLSRLARIGAALVLAVVGVPALVLMPLLALREGLPAEAGVDDVLRPALVLLLVSLALVALVNLVGLSILIGTGLARRRRAGRAGPP